MSYRRSQRNVGRNSARTRAGTGRAAASAPIIAALASAAEAAAAASQTKKKRKRKAKKKTDAAHASQRLCPPTPDNDAVRKATSFTAGCIKKNRTRYSRGASQAIRNGGNDQKLARHNSTSAQRYC